MPRYVTKQQKEAILELREAGLGYDAIRRKTGHSIATIKKYLRAAGALRRYKLVLKHRNVPVLIDAPHVAQAKHDFKEKYPNARVAEMWVRLDGQEIDF